MATDHTGRQTMPTGDEGFPISGWPSRIRQQAAMETWMVRPLYRAPPGIGEASDGGKMGVRLFSLIAGQSTV